MERAWNSWRPSASVPPGYFSTRESQSFPLQKKLAEHPDGEHCPQKKPCADLVALVHDRSDQYLHEPQQEEEPVVFSRLGEEILDQLKIHQPVGECGIRWVSSSLYSK